jgi:hypothetical protein
VYTKGIVCLYIMAALAATGCANPHFFPRLRPLFVDLDETKIPASAQTALLQAKSDFQRARHYEAPRYAAYSGPGFSPRGKVYQGHGYCITMVHEETAFGWLDGPEIALEPSITGGLRYRYSEVDTIKE